VDISNTANLARTAAPESYATNSYVSTLLGTQPSSAASMVVPGNSAYTLGGDNYAYVDRQIHGGKKVKKVKKVVKGI
jgi:hypothetical protein